MNDQRHDLIFHSCAPGWVPEEDMKRVAALALAALVLSGTPGVLQAETGKLKLRVKQTTGGFLITNEGPTKISDCYVTVNSRFKQRGLSFLSNVETFVPASGLMTSNDVRLDLSVDQMQRLHVQCFEPANADVSMG